MSSEKTTARPWTDDDDKFLIFYGHCLNRAFGGESKGYDFVAEHDLGRTPQEAWERVTWLREHKPSLVDELEKEADADVE